MSFTSINMRALVLLCLLQAVRGSVYSWDGNNSTQAPVSDTPVCLNDQAACGCCLIQKQMKRLEQFLNMSADAMSMELVKTKAAINNLRASRSAFSVSLSIDTCYGPYASAQTIVYKQVFINLGNGYDVQSGIFKVPRSGVYSLTVTIYASTTSSTTANVATCAELRVNGNGVATLTETKGGDREDSSSIVAALKLTAGDLVDVVLPAGCLVCDTSVHYNTFTGFLLYATD